MIVTGSIKQSTNLLWLLKELQTIIAGKRRKQRLYRSILVPTDASNDPDTCGSHSKLFKLVLKLNQCYRSFWTDLHNLFCHSENMIATLMTSQAVSNNKPIYWKNWKQLFRENNENKDHRISRWRQVAQNLSIRTDNIIPRWDHHSFLHGTDSRSCREFVQRQRLCPLIELMRLFVVDVLPDVGRSCRHCRRSGVVCHRPLVTCRLVGCFQHGDAMTSTRWTSRRKECGGVSRRSHWSTRSRWRSPAQSAIMK